MSTSVLSRKKEKACTDQARDLRGKIALLKTIASYFGFIIEYDHEQQVFLLQAHGYRIRIRDARTAELRMYRLGARTGGESR